MAIARPNAPSVRVAVGRATRRFSPPASDVNPPADRSNAGDDGAADFVEWAADSGVVALSGSAVAVALENEPDDAAIRLEFRARQEFKAAFFECLKSGATVIEHPQQTVNGDLSAKLRDPDGHLWDLTAPS